MLPVPSFSPHLTMRYQIWMPSPRGAGCLHVRSGECALQELPGVARVIGEIGESHAGSLGGGRSATFTFQSGLATVGS